MNPQQPAVDPKRIFIAMVLIAFLLLGFEMFYSFFFRTSPSQEPKRESITKDEGAAPLPKLMLGTTREKKKEGEVAVFEFGGFELHISTVGGRLVKFIDRTFGFDLITEAERELGVFPLEIYTGDPGIDQAINFGRYEVRKEGNSVIMELKEGKVKVVKRLEFKGSHFLFSVEGLKEKRFYILAGTHPFEKSFYTHEGPVISVKGDILRIDTDEVKGRESYEGHIDFAGEESRYFFKGFKGNINRVVVEGVSYRPVEGEERRITFTYVEYSEPLVLYMGAKYYSRLRDIHLQDLLDWGMLKIFVKPLFVFMYWVFEHTGSWIVSIVLLTLILRVVFFPLNYKSMTSMMKLQKAAPRLEKIRKKYKDDPAKMQEEMMKLYSEIGFNPMSGCLPILVQIPIFFALYKVLIITVDLKLSGMLWIPSLADKDPIYLLPIIMGLTMVLQQKLMPSPDPKQNLIMYISAVAFTFLFASFPSGLVLYWTVNNILNIGQNYLIKNVLLKEK